MFITHQCLYGFALFWSAAVGGITQGREDQRRDNKFYRTGEDNLCKVNDLIEFDYDAKGNVQNLMVTGEATTPPPAVQNQQKQAWAGKGGGGGGGLKQKQAVKDAYWSDKEARDIERDRRQQEIVEPRITWSSAQSDAVAVVTAALQHDLLAFGNANKAAKLGLLLDYVDQVTSRFAALRFNAAALLKDAIAATEGAAAHRGDNDNDLG